MSAHRPSMQRGNYGLAQVMEGRTPSVWWFGPELAWQKRAACAKSPDADSFFPGGGRPSNRSKKTCAECPVRTQCLDHALTYGEEGIWGGLTERERLRLLTSRLPLPLQENR